MSQASANTFLLLLMLVLIVLGIILLRSRFGGFPGRTKYSHTSENQQHGGGAGAPPPHQHHANPAHSSHEAHATGNSGLGHLTKKHLWTLIPWILFGLTLVGGFIYAGGVNLLHLAIFVVVIIGLAIPTFGAMVAKSYKGPILAANISGVIIFSLTLLGILFYMGTGVLHRENADTVRKGWLEKLANITDPNATTKQGENLEKVQDFSKSIWDSTLSHWQTDFIWYAILTVGLFLIVASGWKTNKTEEKKGHH
jgi:hypothetical protein